MSTVSAADFPWKRSRSGFAVFFFFSLLPAGTLLRLVLLLTSGFADPLNAASVARALMIGFHQDFLVALLLTLPLLFWLWILPDSVFEQSWQRFTLIVGSFLFWTTFVFLLIVQFYYFNHYKSRFSLEAAHFLLSHHYYPVAVAAVAGVVASLAWLFVSLRYFHQMWYQPTTTAARLVHFLVTVLICVLLMQTVSLEGTHFSDDHVLNAVANNGAISFFDAVWDWARH